MNNNKLRKLSTFILSICLVFCTACGDTTSNDQGVSFTLLGWFQDSAGTTGASGFVSPLSSNASEVGGELPDVLGFVGVQNHLSGQTIRVQRVYHKYTIPGSKLKVPDTAVALGVQLAPTGAADPNFNADSSLPDSHNTGKTSSYSQVPVVTSAIRSYINLNRNDLPELPFVMVVKSYVQGTTSAGREIISNDTETQVYFTADTIIAPTDGSEEDAAFEDGSFSDESFDESFDDEGFFE